MSVPPLTMVAVPLEAGDSCAAAKQAAALQAATDAAVDAVRVPAAFRAELQGAVRDLTLRIRCEEPEHGDNGKRKGKGKGKGKDEG